MSPASKNGGGRFLSLLLLLALGGILIVLALQARSNRETVAGLRADLEAQKGEMRGLRERMEDLAGDRKKEKQRADAAEDHGKELSARVEDLTARLETVAAELTRTAKERDEHLAARLDLARRLEAAESALAQGRIRREQKEQELAGRLDDFEVLSGDLRQQVAELRADRSETKGRFADLMKELASTRLELESLTAQVQGAVDARRTAEKAAASLGSDLQAALEKAVELRGEADRLKAANAALTASRDELTRRIEGLLEKKKAEEDATDDPTR